MQFTYKLNAYHLNLLLCLFAHKASNLSSFSKVVNQGEGCPGLVREVEIIDMLNFFLMIIYYFHCSNCARTTFASV